MSNLLTMTGRYPKDDKLASQFRERTELDLRELLDHPRATWWPMGEEESASSDDSLMAPRPRRDPRNDARAA